MEDNNNDFILVQGDEMEVSVVRTESPQADTYANQPVRSPKIRFLRVFLLLFSLGFLLVALLAGYFYYQYFVNIGVPISRSPKQNIALLEEMTKAGPSAEVPGIYLSSDSVLGVAMDFLRISNLRGTLSMEEPTMADSSVFLYVRSADYTADSAMIETTIVDGRRLRSTPSLRRGYVAMAGRGTVIGVSPRDGIACYVQDKCGSFFRQFVLVSNGVLPPKFHLHGKVERRAIGRIGNTLYIISTRHKETMWDFADALREYGFTDAIYISGGDDRTFYRTADGMAHPFGSDSTHAQNIPWLVFKK